MYDHQVTSDRFFGFMIFIVCIAVVVAMLAGVTCVGASMQHRQAEKGAAYDGTVYRQEDPCILYYGQLIKMAHDNGDQKRVEVHYLNAQRHCK